MKILLLLIFILFFQKSAFSQVYKCIEDGGRVVYQGAPCQSSAEQKTVVSPPHARGGYTGVDGNPKSDWTKTSEYRDAMIRNAQSSDPTLQRQGMLALSQMQQRPQALPTGIPSVDQRVAQGMSHSDSLAVKPVAKSGSRGSDGSNDYIHGSSSSYDMYDYSGSSFGATSDHQSANTGRDSFAHGAPRGAIDPYTGQQYHGTPAGVIDPSNSLVMPRTAPGQYFNVETGQFMHLQDR